MRTGDDLLVFTKFGVALPHHARQLEAFLSRLTWPNFAPTLLGTTEVVPGYRASILIAWEYVPNDRPLKDGTRRANRDNAARAAAALAGLTDDARRDVPDMLPAPAFFDQPLVELVDEAIERYARQGRDVSSFRAGPEASRLRDAHAPSDRRVAEISQCAQRARITSGGRFHPESCRFALVAGERRGWVTGWAEAS